MHFLFLMHFLFQKGCRQHKIQDVMFSLEISVGPNLPPIFFGLFLAMYLMTVLENPIIILTMCYNSHIKSSMQFFLFNLCLTDSCLKSFMVLKMIVMFNSHLLMDCLTQMSLFIYIYMYLYMYRYTCTCVDG